MSQHISRNSSFWHLSEIANDRSAVVDSACSVALAATTDRESMARIENNFVIGLQLLRQHNRVRMYFGWKRIDPISSLGVRRHKFFIE
jgi:hypothetical protein